MRTRLSKYFLGSVGAHALLAVGVIVVAAKQQPLALAPAPRSIEMEFTAPPARTTPEPTPAAQPQPPEPQPAVQPQPSEPRPSVSARTIRDPQATPSQNTAVEPNPNGTTEPNAQANGTNTGATEPQNTGTPNPNGATGTGRVLTGLGLIPTDSNTEGMITAANLGGVALATGDPNRALRRNGIFGPSRRCTGTPEECARAVAMAPITEALGSQQRPNPAGTGAHAAAVAREAGVAFSPVRQIPNISAIVSRGILVTPSSTREAPAGERSHNSEFASRTGIDMGSGTVTVPQPSYRMVRAEIEVDQDAEGAITETRVATTSHSNVFDQAAQRAIREALSEADPFRTASRRRSRWAFEVSEGEPPGRIDRMIRGGGNEGWRVSPEQSNGMHIRYRVRMVSMRLLTDPAQPGATPTTGRSG
jgi:outer membrane biosynthesis protein TonB